MHGDLLGNALFADGLPSAIIDWPVYYRPPAWAHAVAVVDALVWHDANPTLIARWADQPAWHEMLLRALIYRMATDSRARNCLDFSRYQLTIDIVLTPLFSRPP